MTRRGLLLAGLAALLLTLAVRYSLRLEPPPTPDAESVEAPPRYALTQARWLRLDAQGRPQFRAQAAEIRFYADESAVLDDLTLDALGGFDSPWRLQAPSASVPRAQKRMRLDGPVTADGRLAPDEPARFTAKNLWVDHEQRLLSTEDDVRITTPTREGEAGGLRTDFKGRELALFGDVRVTYAATP